MAESIVIPKDLSKEERYESLIPQLNALVEGEKDLVANLANMMGALKQAFDFFWVGVYLVKENLPRGSDDQGDELVLGPFQGPVACTRIAYGKGVCGTSWKNAETIIVKNVDEFPGHIACNAESKSEIVIPFFKNNKVAGVIDVDSDKLADFDETDSMYLSEVARLIETFIK